MQTKTLSGPISLISTISTLAAGMDLLPGLLAAGAKQQTLAAKTYCARTTSKTPGTTVHPSLTKPTGICA